MFSKCLVFGLVLHVVLARSTGVSPENSIHETARSSEASSVFGDFKYVFKVYQECAAKELGSCLKMKLITALDRAAKSYNEIPLFEGVRFVREPNAPVENEIKSEAELEATLPRAIEDQQEALDGLISDRVSNFLESHTLQIKLPTSSDYQRSLEEGRGKKKKNSSGLLLLPLILGGTLVPLALGALALLAGKALIVSKLALVLAAIIGVKKLLSGSGGGHESGHVEVISGGHSGWGRAYNKEDTQNLAYSAYAPKTTTR